ncbi:MAG: HD domain-containing protein [Oscillospiraceae bacterium]|jgi:metal-dependent HD superfamily phosphatase/phosphodiesterase|nr:HD domain-containing protein [Oscillospiraceae bacterium]
MQNYNHITFEDILKNDEIKAYIKTGNRNLGEIGFTEHGFPHAKRSANYAGNILQQLGFDERTCELARIAGYMHDIGNVVNRYNHAHSGALMAFNILNRLNMPPQEVAVISAAIGNHDEETAAAVSPIAAALILSDKGDVRRTRVRDRETVNADIHDRVNYAVEHAATLIDTERKTVTLDITIDTNICPVMEYFEIFMSRMVLCRRAAQYLGLQFELIINETRLL